MCVNHLAEDGLPALGIQQGPCRPRDPGSGGGRLGGVGHPLNLGENITRSHNCDPEWEQCDICTGSIKMQQTHIAKENMSGACSQRRTNTSLDTDDLWDQLGEGWGPVHSAVQATVNRTTVSDDWGRRGRGGVTCSFWLPSCPDHPRTSLADDCRTA